MPESKPVVTATLDGKTKKLTLVLEAHKATPSKSGKTMMIASTNGNVETEVQVDGKTLYVGVNAYYKP